MYIAIQSGFGFEVVISKDLFWICEKIRVDYGGVLAKWGKGSKKVEAWDGEKQWEIGITGVEGIQNYIEEYRKLRGLGSDKPEPGKLF